MKIDKFLLAGALGLAVAAFGAIPRESPYTMTADEVDALPAQLVGISPKTNPAIPIGATYQFTVTSTSPIAANVISRSPSIASVTNAVTGLVTGVSVGTAWIVASVFNGHCMVNDSARITVVDTTTAPVAGDSALGRIAWRNNCTECHTDDTPISLELFHFPDTAVVRRARPHVDTLTSLDIAAAVAAIGPGGPLTRTTRIYQPGSPATSVANDSMFMVTLAGSDAWPTRWTRDTLRNADFRNVRIPLDMPLWSNEATTYDWVPGQGGLSTGRIPPLVLASGLVQTRYATWRATPNLTNAILLAEGLGSKAHDATIADAPCMYDKAPSRYTNETAQICADVHKYGASLCYLTGIRNGITADSIGKRCEPVWWELGHMFHKAQQHQKTIQDRAENICAWIYLGALWTGAAGYTGFGGTGQGEASLYMAGPCGNPNGTITLKLLRWTTWFSIVDLAKRPGTSKGSTEACRDMWSAALYGYDPYLLNAMNVALDIMIYRLANGEQTADSKGTCTAGSSSTTGSIGTAGYLGDTMQEINQCCSAVYLALKVKADTVRARINRL